MITPSSEFWKLFKGTPGALSTAEALAIMNISSLAPEGIFLELGTHKGKSAMSAMEGLPNGVFYMVDPIFKEDDVFYMVLENFKKLPETYHISILLNTDISLNFLNDYKDEYSYVFVDSGSHGDGLPMQEVKMLEDRMVKGGIISMHDYKNQFVEVEQAYNYLLSTGKYEDIPIDWNEIFDYVKEHNLEEGNNSWHLYPELPHPPNFVGALKRI